MNINLKEVEELYSSYSDSKIKSIIKDPSIEMIDSVNAVFREEILNRNLQKIYLKLFDRKVLLKKYGITKYTFNKIVKNFKSCKCPHCNERTINKVITFNLITGKVFYTAKTVVFYLGCEGCVVKYIKTAIVHNFVYGFWSLNGFILTVKTVLEMSFKKTFIKRNNIIDKYIFNDITLFSVLNNNELQSIIYKRRLSKFLKR